MRQKIPRMELKNSHDSRITGEDETENSHNIVELKKLKKDFYADNFFILIMSSKYVSHNFKCGDKRCTQRTLYITVYM